MNPYENLLLWLITKGQIVMVTRLLSFLFLIFLLNSPVVGQQLSSDCSIPQSFKDDYQKDINHLAVRVMQNDQHLSDSIRIPHALKDTIARAMAAVYNANQPVTDSLFNHFQIQTFPKPTINQIRLGIDSSVFKALSFNEGDSTIGIQDIDNKLKRYQFYITAINNASTHPTVTLKTNNYLNLIPLTEKLGRHPATRNVAPLGWEGDGDDIQYESHPNYQQLNFKLKWGDCPAGCINERVYQFKIYDDCSLAYTTYGDKIPNNVHKQYSDALSSNHNANNLFGPNQADSFAIVRSRQITYNEFTLEIIKPVLRTEISIMTTGGTVIRRRVKKFNNIPATESFNLTGHPGGIYFIILITPEKQQLLKVVKKGAQY